MMKEKSVNINYVLERDIDLLLIEEMYSNDEFVNLFTEKIDVYDFDLLNISHSVMDNVYGESDIVLYIKSNNKTIGLFIENKIDAKAMEDQYYRYEVRASDLVKKNVVDTYYIFIVAPEQYLATNQEAKKYPYSISYEKIESYFNQFSDSRSRYKSHLISLAIEKRLKGYTPVEDLAVTQFWKNYYQYKNDYFPYLKLNEIDGPRGSRAVWPWFDTDCTKVKIAHKSDRGFVDLTFFGSAKHDSYFEESVMKYLDNDMYTVVTSNSMAIRVNVPRIDFKESFNRFEHEISTVFDALNRLNELSKKIIKEKNN